MALIKFGSIVTGISGKIGGQTFGTGRAGAYVRNTGTIGRAPSINQQQVRASLASAASRWRLLSDDQRTAWDNAASALTYKNRLGEDKVPSGYQLFMQRNANIIKAGGIKIDLYVAGSQPDAITVDVEALEEGLFEVAIDPTSASERVVLSATAQLSPGQSATLGDMRQLFIKGQGQPATLLDLTAKYEEMYGTIQVGSRVAITSQTVNMDTGMASVFTAIVSNIAE